MIWARNQAIPAPGARGQHTRELAALPVAGRTSASSRSCTPAERSVPKRSNPDGSDGERLNAKLSLPALRCGRPSTELSCSAIFGLASMASLERTRRENGGPSVPVVATKKILEAAFTHRYGVAAFNVVNDITLEAVIAAATELGAPLIVQTSVKTVKSVGLDPLYALFRAY